MAAIVREDREPTSPPAASPQEAIPSEQEPLMKTAQVAKALGVSPRAVRDWADAGWMKCYRTFGGHRLFPLSEVRRALERLRQSHSPQRDRAMRRTEEERGV
jgi:excisionase family DNA binding protein